MKILSVNIGRAAKLAIGPPQQQRHVLSAIVKTPASGPVQLGKMGLAGDEQADLSVHGGLDKAVYAYPSEHYPFWQQRLQAARRPFDLTAGAFGENLTLQGVLEADIWVGDRLHCGDAVLQVTEPRTPCFKFNLRLGFSHAAQLMVQSGYSGFYLRVVQTGSLQAGASLALLPGPRQVSIAQLNAHRRKGRQQDLF
jgi:MOSC domain-containing protein YiiM